MLHLKALLSFGSLCLSLYDEAVTVQAAEKMRISFPTKALAIRLLDKFMAAIPGEVLPSLFITVMTGGWLEHVPPSTNASAPCI